MSIAVLNQVYDEARRLAVAGSAVARGDFRLKKLLPPLEQAGAKTPVFAKVAECARAVIDGPEDTSAASLLELTSLVTAVLYTQGETGIAGPLEPIETVELGGTTAATSARLLKPLLEALNSTGSGRLELVTDAHKRGAFRDLRLIKPALDGLDDPYSEIADFIAEKVLPMYGKAVLPELRAKFDPKGTKGHPRRLSLMHAIDPAGTRDLVKQALETGSKEVKVAAITCLGADADNLPFLIEQASAKAHNVRRAAYYALATSNDASAVAVLAKALAGKDAELVAGAIAGNTGEAAVALLVAEVGKASAEIVKLKDKKQIGTTARRLIHLFRALTTDDHPATVALILDLFGRRSALAKVKGDTASGSDVVEAVVWRMARGPKALQLALARAHTEVEGSHLTAAFNAARQVLPPDEVYDLFAGYLTAKPGAKKGASLSQRDTLIHALDAGHIYWYPRRDPHPYPLDPRWLDAAVKIGHLALVDAVGRPGHSGAEAFLRAEFDAAVTKSKSPTALLDVVAVMVRLRHPDAVDALVRAYEKSAGKPNFNTFWFHHLIPGLPASAVPRLEAVVPKLKDREADLWLAAIQELRTRV